MRNLNADLLEEPQMPDDPDLMTAAEAAEYLFASENSLRSMRSKQKGPPFVKVGRLVRYRRSELQRYVATLSTSAATQLKQRKAKWQNEKGRIHMT